MTTTATPYCGLGANKLYLVSGQFSTTILSSASVSAISTQVSGVCFDRFNASWTARNLGDVKLYLQSGQYTSTLKTSEDISAIDNDSEGISYDGTNTPWIGDQANKFYLQSGQFTSTLKTSTATTSQSFNPRDISWDGTNTPWIADDSVDNDIQLNSGQFTTTSKTSLSVNTINNVTSGISWDGANTPWTASGFGGSKLYLQSGQFTSTLKTSVATADTSPSGVDTNDFDSRTGLFVVEPSSGLTIGGSATLSTYYVAPNGGLALGGTSDPVSEYLFEDFQLVILSSADVRFGLGWVSSGEITLGSSAGATLDVENTFFYTSSGGLVINGGSGEIVTYVTTSTGGINGFGDNFNRSNIGPDWTLQQNNWVISNSRITVPQLTDSSPAVLVRTLPFGNNANYFVEAEVITESIGTPTRAVGVVGRLVNTDEFYGLYLNQSNSRLELFTSSSGYSFALLDDASVTIVPDSSHLIKLFMMGDKIKGFFDNQEVISVVDSTYTATGKVGISYK